MSTKEKLIKRFKRQPKDFTWDELVRLFSMYSFTIDNKGKTSGSRFIFKKDNEKITIHKPHPFNFIKEYEMKEILNFLTNKGLINKED